MEFTLLGAALLGVAFMLATMRIQRARGVTDRRDLMDVAFGAIVVGMAVGRIAAIVLEGTNPFTHPLDLFFVRGGVDTGFASVGALAFLAWSTRRNPWPTLDLLAPPALAGLGGWHAGCLLRGSCAGTVTSLPWAIHDGTAGRHPVELYAALLLIAGAVLLFAVARRLPAGVAAFGALAFAAAVRLATEPLRVGIGSTPAPWYIAGIVAGLAGLTIRVIRGRSRNIADS